MEGLTRLVSESWRATVSIVLSTIGAFTGRAGFAASPITVSCSSLANRASSPWPKRSLIWLRTRSLP